MGKKYYQRNQFLFNQRTVDSVRILQDIKVRAEEIQSLNNSPLVVGTRKIERWITWKQPIWPWCKLNTDGASKETGASSFCSVTVAELWGLYQDLSLAWQHGIRYFHVEVDSCCVVQMVNARQFAPMSIPR